MSEKEQSLLFYSFYKTLNPAHKEIVFQTISQMKKRKNQALCDITFEVIEEERKKQGLTKKQLSKLIAETEKRDPDRITDTYKAWLKRKSFDSVLTEDAMTVLKISPGDKRFYKGQLDKVTDIIWQFDSISKDNKNAIISLVSGLYRIENMPESFE